MSVVEIGPGNALGLIDAAIRRGAKAGDVLTLTDSKGNSQQWTLGEITSAPDRKWLIAFAVGES